MAKKSRPDTARNPLQGCRMSGMITYEGTPYEVWLNSRNGSIAFVQDGVWVDSPQLQDQLMAYLLQANQAE